MSAEARTPNRGHVAAPFVVRCETKSERRSVAVECKYFAVMGMKHPEVEEPECTEACCGIGGRFYYDPFVKEVIR